VIKKIFFFLFVFFFLFGSLVKAQNTQIYLFWSDGCPHCAKEKVFLEKLKQEYLQIEIKSYKIDEIENQKLLIQMAENLKVPENLVGLVPFTVIGDKYFVGFRDEQTTGVEIRKAAEGLLSSAGDSKDSAPLQTLKIPLLGKIKTKNLSLPVLTIVLGLLDGFNPCAMWTLLFLISMLLRVKEKKRRWVLGMAFILTSGLVYFLIMNAWLNLFLLLGFIFWVRIVVGLVALGAGAYSLRDYWKNREGGCKVIEEEKRNRVFEKIRTIVGKKELIFALGGIVLLALAVNLIELVCSAGLPAIYTQVLALSNLSVGQYYLYLLLYILFFMIDDLSIFFVAMVTLQAVGIESKYARFSRLIGGILILTIGFLLLFKPEWLIFG